MLLRADWPEPLPWPSTCRESWGMSWRVIVGVVELEMAGWAVRDGVDGLYPNLKQEAYAEEGTAKALQELPYQERCNTVECSVGLRRRA